MAKYLKFTQLAMTSVAAGCSLFGAAVTSAQEATAANVAPTISDDIVVTARRREESLARVPVAVSALSADQLKSQAVFSQVDLQRTVPGLTIRQTSNANQFNYSIRGQSIDAFTGSRPAVVPYVNDFYFSSSAPAPFYDLESVQVLKGPQGTLFGRNATGGAVLYATTRPKDGFGGFATLRAGSYSMVEGQGAINLPIVEGLAALRIAGDAKRERGFIQNVFTGRRAGGGHSWSGRVSLLLTPADGMESTTVAQYSRAKGTNSGIQLYSAYPCGSSNKGIPLATTISCLYSPQLDAIFNAPGAWQAFLDAHPGVPAGGLQEALTQQQALGPYRTALDNPLAFQERSYFLMNTTSFELDDNLSIKNIIGFARSKALTNSDYDGSPFPIAINRAGAIDQVGSRYEFRNFSEELQLLGKAFDDKLDYIVGVYHATEGNHQYQPLLTVDLSPVLTAGDASYIYRLSNRSTALFAQATYNITDRFSFTGGYRHTWEINKIRQMPGSIFYPTVGENLEEAKVNKPSWQLGLNFQATPDLLVYAVHRGSWRSGGYNGGAPPINVTAPSGGNLFEPETTKDVELGLKYSGRLAEVPTRFNIALFRQQVNDIQRVIYAVISGNIAAVTGSVPEAVIKGVEADLSISPSAWLTLGGSLAYVDAKYTKDTATLFGQNFRFGPYADTPKWSGSAFAQAELPLDGGMGTLLLRGDIYAQSHQFFSNLNDTVSPGTRLHGYHLVNVRAEWKDIAGSGISVAGYASNLTKEKYYTGGLPLGAAFGLNSAVVGRPRTFGAEATVAF